MASAVLSSVLTTASRFALLQVDSGSGSDSEPGKGKGRNNGKPQALGNKPTTNEKKREKRRKKKEQQQSEANEVAARSLSPWDCESELHWCGHCALCWSSAAW